MTIIGIVLFMVPFTSLCIFIMIWGICDLRNQKRESQQSQKLNQERNQINSTSSLHRSSRSERQGYAERQAKNFANLLHHSAVKKIRAVLSFSRAGRTSLIFQS